MVKVETIENFTLKDFKKVKLIKKQSSQKDLFLKGDIFECDDEMAKYLETTNKENKAFIKILEVIPEKEDKKELKEVVKRTRKKKTNIEK